MSLIGSQFFPILGGVHWYPLQKQEKEDVMSALGPVSILSDDVSGKNIPHLYLATRSHDHQNHSF